MPVSYSPKVVTDSLAACWDASTLKSYDPKENLFLHSNNFTVGVATWGTGENLWTSSAIGAPDGTLTGWKAVNNSNTNNFNFANQFLNTTTGGIYTFSIHFKNIDLTTFTVIMGTNGLNSNAVFWYDTATNTISSVYNPGGNSIVESRVVDVANGWKRISITVNVSNLATAGNHSLSNVGAAFYLGQSGNTSASYTKSAYIWGAQLERNLTPSTYSITTTSQYAKSTSLVDLTGNENNLTAQNFPLWSGDNGGFFRLPTLGYFSGTGNSTLPVKNAQYTLQAWIRYPNATVINGGGILSIGTHSSTFGLYNSIRNLSAFGSFSHWWFGNNLDISTNVAGIVANQWYLITAVYYPFSLRRLYVNTTLIGSDSPTENHDVPFNPTIEIGRAANNTFGADVARCSVYRTALSLEKITQNYNAHRPRFNA